MDQLARILIGLAVILLVAGLILLVFARLGFSRLPGDIFIRRGNFSFYFPVTTSIILSIVLSLLLRLIRK